MSSSPSEPDPKKLCTMKTIGTHSGNFHCDEALACYMLKLLPEYKDARYDEKYNIPDMDCSCFCSIFCCCNVATKSSRDRGIDQL